MVDARTFRNYDIGRRRVSLLLWGILGLAGKPKSPDDYNLIPLLVASLMCFGAIGTIFARNQAKKRDEVHFF